MKVERRPKETNPQLIRRLGHLVMLDGRLEKFKEAQYFTAPLSRFLRRQRALARAKIARRYRAY